MMIVVAHLKVSGAFRALGALAVEHAHAPFALLVATTRRLPALCRRFWSMTRSASSWRRSCAGVTRALDRDPLPYLVAIATASNCGSVATITGNPQNMVIGALSGISYPVFAAALAPVAAFGLVAVIVVVRLVYARNSRQAAKSSRILRGRIACRAGRQGELRLRRAGGRVLCRRASRESGDSRRRVPASDARDQASPHLSRTRWAAPYPVCRHVRRGCGRGKGAADARSHGDGENPRPRCGLAAFAVHRRALQCREQCPRGPCLEAVYSDARPIPSAPGSLSP